MLTSRKFRPLVAGVGAVMLSMTLVTTTSCEPSAVNRWLAEHKRPQLTEPALSRVTALLTAFEVERDRRQSYVGEIAAVDEARLGLSWRPGCPVGPADLRLLRVSFWGFDNVGHVGELIVNAKVAARTVGVFRQLWNEKFPINRMETAEKFARPEDFNPDGTFIESHAGPDTVNDTSAFFCRPNTGSTTSWSQHSYGTAIDINPVQNPYVKGATTIPINGSYQPGASGTIVSTGIVVKAMKRAGFKWGGGWKSLKDYMHFSTSGT